MNFEQSYKNTQYHERMKKNLMNLKALESSDTGITHTLLCHLPTLPTNGFPDKNRKKSAEDNTFPCEGEAVIGFKMSMTIFRKHFIQTIFIYSNIRLITFEI